MWLLFASFNNKIQYKIFDDYMDVVIITSQFNRLNVSYVVFEGKDFYNN